MLQSEILCVRSTSSGGPVSRQSTCQSAGQARAKPSRQRNGRKQAGSNRWASVSSVPSTAAARRVSVYKSPARPAPENKRRLASREDPATAHSRTPPLSPLAAPRSHLARALPAPRRGPAHGHRRHRLAPGLGLHLRPRRARRGILRPGRRLPRPVQVRPAPLLVPSRPRWARFRG